MDDEALIRWSIAETLTSAGHTVVEACNGAEAVRALTEGSNPPDAVMLDYRLPDSNDLTLLANIRQIAPRSPVILMTAFGTPEIARGARELGVYRILNKPFDVHELDALLVNACSSSPA